MNRLADKLGARRQWRGFNKGVLYLIPVTEIKRLPHLVQLDPLTEFPDIREELNWIGGI